MRMKNKTTIKMENIEKDFQQMIDLAGDADSNDVARIAFRDLKLSLSRVDRFVFVYQYFIEIASETKGCSYTLSFNRKDNLHVLNLVNTKRFEGDNLCALVVEVIIYILMNRTDNKQKFQLS